MTEIEQLEQNIHILLERYQTLQKENALLREDLKEQRQEIIRSHSELQELQKQCRLLNMANAIAGDPSTRESAYKRLTYIITQVDKAIAALATENINR